MNHPLHLSRLPPIPKALADKLEEYYPVAMPNLTDPDRLIFFKAGQVDVVRFIRQEYEFQQRQESLM